MIDLRADPPTPTANRDALRVAITTLGCKVNRYDSASIETELRRQGCAIVPFDAYADVYIVNSCTVTDRADAESRQLIRRARRLAPQSRIIITGCFAQTSPQAAAIPEVDHVVGLSRLPDLVRAATGVSDERILVNDLRTARSVSTLGADTFTGQTRAFLKIQEGCDLFCTFCIVPFARGRSRSVPPRTVLAQLQMLAERGFQEVVLTGVHLGGYGHDLDEPLGLAELLEMVAEKAPIGRVRLSSLDPPEVSARVLAVMRNSQVLCDHLHVPLQSGSDRVLQRMRRKYDTALVREMTASVREYLPEAALGTDVIAGFPGETEGEFEDTLSLLNELSFTYLHVFPYSKRSGTTAAKLAEQVSGDVVRDRARQLRKLGEGKQRQFARGFVGRSLAVLLEDFDGDGATHMKGYSRNYQRVEIPAAPELANQEVQVVIDSFNGGHLLGRIEPVDATTAR